jgi:hypothetical protein
MTILPYPLDYKTAQDYCRAVKPLMEQWRLLMQPSQFRSPYDEWHFEQRLADEYPELRTT